MVTLAVAGSWLRARLGGWSRVWALSAGFDAPLAAVSSARVDPALRLAPDGMRVGGTFFPGSIAAGRHGQPGFSAFWYVRTPKRAVVIDLTGWRHDRLVLQVGDPEAATAGIRRAAGIDHASADPMATG